jgi:hypothetical protein
MTKVADDRNCGNDDILFFAEVKCVRQGKQEELLVSCFCIVNLTKNGMLYPSLLDQVLSQSTFLWAALT